MGELVADMRVSAVPSGGALVFIARDNSYLIRKEFLMKRNLKKAIPLLIVAVMLVTTLCVFVGVAGAATTSEATLSTRTVTYGSAGYATAYGTATSDTGDFATLAAKLDDFAPTAHTQYTLKLNSDVVISTPVNIVANEYAEIVIDLNGYNITTQTAGDAFNVSGAGTVRIVGHYATDGSAAKIVYAQSGGAILSVADGSTARVNFRDIGTDLSALTAGPAIKAAGGELVLYNTSLASDKALNLVEVKGAVAELKLATVSGASATAVYAEASNVYLQDSTITTASGVLTKGASNVLSVDTDFTCATPISAESAATVYILGGRVETTGSAIVSGGCTTVGLYYGSGDTTVVGDDPANYTVQESCSFAKNSSGEWVMSCSSTKEAMGTKAVLGSAPVVSYNTFSKTRSNHVGSASITTPTAHIITALKDASCETYSNNSFTATEYFNYVIDYNGHTVTVTATGSWNFDTYGNMYVHYDGADVEGKVGKLVLDSKNCMLFRTRVKSGYLGANLHTLVNLTDLDCELTKFDEGSNPPICIQQGSLIVDGVNFTYTGTLASISATRSFNVYHVGSTTATGTTWAHIKNSTVTDASGNNLVKITGATLIDKSKTQVWFDNFVTDNLATAVNTNSGCTAVIKNSNLEATSTAYTGTGSVSIYDTVTTVTSGNVSNGNPTFYYGSGKNEIFVGDADLTGSYGVEEGYVILMMEKGRFTLMKADDIVQPSIRMPAIFANNMVLQRNKEINVFGYCDTVGATVEVTLAGKVATATVDEKGEWCATFEPMGAMFDQTMEVRQTGKVAYNLKKFTGINIGEIWVMSGQSNGDLQSLYMEDLSEYYALAGANKSIRMYRSSQGYSVTEQEIGSGTWYEATPDKIANKTSSVTAIGYAMAVKLADELGDDVPIAIMHMVRGSCKIKTWLDYKRIQEVSPSATAEYEYWLGQNSLPSSAHGGGAVATVMYNNVIAPVYGFEVAGVLWYQGEGDTGGGYFASTDKKKFPVSASDPEETDNCYTEFFYALEDTFREAFGNDPNLPFYVMQLSPFLSSSYDTSNVYNLKMEQYEMCANEPNTHLVSLGLDGAVLSGAFFAGNLDPDMGSASVSAQGFIHPTRKSTVGIRTADLILANEYGIKHNDIYTYPTPIKATFSGGKVTVEFDTELRYLYGDSVMGFEIYDGSKWVRATGKIEGNKVILTAEGITKATEVRYGCGEMVMELADGTLIEVWDKKNTYGTGKTNYSLDSAAQTLTVEYNGNTYVVRGNTTDMVRTMDYGNLTNLSGIPLPLFRLEVK